MDMPLLIVTGRTGAWGNIKRIADPGGKASAGTIGSKSCPSAPKPCSQITVASGESPTSDSIASKYSLIKKTPHLIDFMIKKKDNAANITALVFLLFRTS
jgi:hypothetical protein